MKKLSVFLAVVVASSTLFTACGAPQASPSPVAAAPATAAPATVAPATVAPATVAPATVAPATVAPATGKQTTMRVIWWGSQTRHDYTQAAMKLFTEKNPNIKLEAEFLSWDGYWERLAAQIAGNNLADVFQQDYQYLKKYADNKTMLDLTPYKNKGLDVTNIEENTLKGGEIGGKLYAVSLGLNSQCVAWDPAMFEKAGIAPPPERWTWAQYMDTAKQLKAKLNVYGDEYFTSSYYHGLNLWLRQHGFSVYAPDGTGLGYTDDALFASYYQMDLDLIKQGVVPTPDIRDEILSPESQLIVTQKAAMLGSLGGSNQLAAVVKAAGRPLKLTSLPYTEGDKSGQFLKPSQFFSVYSGTKTPDEAVKFVDFITNDVDANMLLKGERGVPISSKIRTALTPTLDDTQKEIFRYIDSVSKFAYPIGSPEPPQHAELDIILKNIRFEILSGSMSPADGAKKYRSEAERVFKK